MPLPTLLYTAHLETTSRLAELYDDSCVEGGDDQCTSWFDAERDLAIIEYYCATQAEAEHRLAAMESFFQPHRAGEPLAGIVHELPAQDWAETWKKFFHAEKVSDRIWIKPSWESCSAGPGDIIVEIDPGMSFGTGQHGTTRGCLQMMDRLATSGAGQSLADIGCGSGILAIAAVKLGYSGLIALDNDPDAVRIARENAALNRVAGAIRFVTGDCAAAGINHSHDVVVANILATVLVANAAVLTSYLSLASNARLILSGILNPQADEVKTAYEAQDMNLVESLQLGEWTTLCLKRK